MSTVRYAGRDGKEVDDEKDAVVRKILFSEMKTFFYQKPVERVRAIINLFRFVSFVGLEKFPVKFVI